MQYIVNSWLSHILWYASSFDSCSLLFLCSIMIDLHSRSLIAYRSAIHLACFSHLDLFFVLRDTFKGVTWSKEEKCCSSNATVCRRGKEWFIGLLEISSTWTGFFLFWNFRFSLHLDLFSFGAFCSVTSVAHSLNHEYDSFWYNFFRIQSSYFSLLF